MLKHDKTVNWFYLQLLTQVLNCITACSNLFDNVTRLHLPGLETVDRFPVLGAVAGILITLVMQGTQERLVCMYKELILHESEIARPWFGRAAFKKTLTWLSTQHDSSMVRP